MRKDIMAGKPPPPKSTDWRRKFDDPILLPDGKKLVTLKDAIEHLSKPKRNRRSKPEVRRLR